MMKNSDIYSLGCILFQLLYLDEIHRRDQGEIKQIKFKKRDGMSDECYNLLKGMLKVDQNERPELQYILKKDCMKAAIFRVYKKLGISLTD